MVKCVLVEAQLRTPSSNASVMTVPLHHGLGFSPNTLAAVGTMSIFPTTVLNKWFTLTPGPIFVWIKSKNVIWLAFFSLSLVFIVTPDKIILLEFIHVKGLVKAIASIFAISFVSHGLVYVGEFREVPQAYAPPPPWTNYLIQFHVVVSKIDKILRLPSAPKGWHSFNEKAWIHHCYTCTNTKRLYFVYP